MRQDQLIPKAARKMRQPKKDTLREQLILAADTIQQQRVFMDYLRLPWWRRIFRRAP